MSDTEDEGQGPVDEKVPAYVKSIMESVPEEDIASIVDQVSALGGTPHSRLKVAAQTGISLGVELAFRDMYEAYDMALSGLIHAVERLDQMMNEMQDKELIRKLAEVRNPMAKMVDSCTKSVSPDDRIQAVVSAFGLPESMLKQPVRETGEFDLSNSGLMAYGITRKWPEMFNAYVCFANDKSITCRCPWHFRMALHDLSAEEARARFDRAMDTYPPGSEQCNILVQEFVQWWVNCARGSYQAALSNSEDDLKPPLVSEAESRLLTEDMLSRLGVGAKKS